MKMEMEMDGDSWLDWFSRRRVSGNIFLVMSRDLFLSERVNLTRSISGINFDRWTTLHNYYLCIPYIPQYVPNAFHNLRKTVR